MTMIKKKNNKKGLGQQMVIHSMHFTWALQIGLFLLSVTLVFARHLILRQVRGIVIQRQAHDTAINFVLNTMFMIPI